MQPRNRRRLAAGIACALVAVAVAAAASSPAADPDYPRFTPAQLHADGYPDPHYKYNRKDWTPRTDAEGRAFGYGSLCRGAKWLDRPDARVSDGRLEVGHFVVTYNAGYQICEIAPFVEFCEAALVDVEPLLGLTTDDTLRIIDPDNLDDYRDRTSYEPWRMYKYLDGACVVQPIPILMTRTLAPHAAYDLVACWLLDRNGCGALPAWLREGVAAYAADLGVHLNNYMAMYRPSGPVLMDPARTNGVLTSPPLADKNEDQRLFREARYSAFVMAWRLIEDNGGPDRLRALLQAVRDGAAPDAACRAAYGVGLDDLAARLDATQGTEPIGDAVQPRRPGVPAKPNAAADSNAPSGNE